MNKLNKELIVVTKSFKSWLPNRYGVVKFSMKLEKYYELSLDEFMDELKKKKVDTDALPNSYTSSKRFHREHYSYKSFAPKNKGNLSEIDQMVYELYGLTSGRLR